MSETKRKLTFWQSVENFWYYYKWWVIAGIFITLGVWVFCWFSASQGADKTGDLTVLSVYAHPLTSEEYDLDRRLSEYIPDVNADGEQKVVLESYIITEKGTGQSDQMSKMQFESNLQECFGDLMLFDTPSLNSYLAKDIFAPIGDYVDLSQIPKEDIIYRNDVAVAVKLSESKLLSDMHFIIDEVYASVMFIPDDADEATLKTRENAKIAISELLKKEL